MRREPGALKRNQRPGSGKSPRTVEERTNMSAFQLSTYINFQGRAREAMEFYHQVLGGTLDLHTINEQGQPVPANEGARIAHAQLDADGARIIGTDGHPSYPATAGDNMAIALRGTDSEQLTSIFNALAEGGKVKMPLTEQPWGAAAGWLTDKFGINWTVDIAKA
jgi:PhnB protein